MVKMLIQGLQRFKKIYEHSFTLFDIWNYKLNEIIY